MNISYNLLNTKIEYCWWKTEWLSWYRTVVSVLIVYPCGLADRELCCPASWERIMPYITSPGKRPKFQIWSSVSTECLSLLHHCKVERSLSQTMVSRGPSVCEFSFHNCGLAYMKILQWYKIPFNLLYNNLSLWKISGIIIKKAAFRLDHFPMIETSFSFYPNALTLKWTTGKILILLIQNLKEKNIKSKLNKNTNFWAIPLFSV